jgi:Domain of unknown function (DUF4430)
LGLRPHIPFAAIAVVLTAAIAGGCGLGPGRGTSNVSVTVTRAFGSEPVASITRGKVPGSETVMRMLERSFKVTTRYGGGFVESIEGISGNASRRDWFYYVNGVQARVGAASTAVHRGDRIWWDLHDWSATNSVPAVVGSFPEPFAHGEGGRRLPTTLECASDASAACKRVAAQLKAVGVPVAAQLLGTGAGTDSLAVLVGTWSDLHGTIAADLIAHGPSASGVYARFAGPGGNSLELLDPRARVLRRLGSGAGLIAATGQGSAAPTWLVTGTDAGGVAGAAAALTPGRLHDHFALAVQRGAELPVPLQGAR